VHNDTRPASIDFHSDSAPSPEPNLRKAHIQRISRARDRLAAALRSISTDDCDRVSKVFRLLDRLERDQIDVASFLRAYQRVCGEDADRLFCDVAAAVSVPRTRARLVRLRTGSLPCRIPSSGSCPAFVESGTNGPSGQRRAPPPPPPQPQPPESPPPGGGEGRKKGKGKKIVIRMF
jgi:hypothetical protein